ncbi:hypothetical protein LJK88_22865 [Paenibacillus sp. P26]|nr:hypothetical protein LJK88_22865 [Paenibacillus sp. P26]
MKKKSLWIGAGAAVGGVLLISSAYAGIGDTPGYDAYKSAFKTTVAAKSMTENATVHVTDNGGALLDITSSAKTDKSEPKCQCRDQGKRRRHRGAVRGI